jgi:hypothetical protein
VPMDKETCKKVLNGSICVHKTHPVLSLKLNKSGQIACYKVHLVVQGYSMSEGIDYEKTFSPCAQLTTVCLLIVLAICNRWSVTHSDVPNAYLNGKASKLVIVKLPAMWSEIMGDQIGLSSDPVVMANSLYGTPDAGHNWNRTFTATFINEG